MAKQESEQVGDKPNTSKGKKEDFKTSHYEKASAGLLAQQAAVPPENKAKEFKDWQILRSHLETRLTGLYNWRQSWWALNWSNLAAFILPRRSIMLTQSVGGQPTPNNMIRGQPLNDAIVNPHATYCARVCAAGLMNGLASPSRQWFKMRPAAKDTELDAEGRAWVDDVEQRIYTVLGSSNFYNSFAQECEDLTVFGTAPCIIYEDEADVIRCYAPTVGEYYLASSSTMRIDGLYRKYVMTCAQAIDFFGDTTPPEQIKSLWKQKGAALDQEQIVAHSIEPNFGIGGTDAGKLPGNFTWREVYWVWGSGAKQPLAVRGFVECPFTVARWATQSNDAYGRGPGMDVLPDVMQLQHECRKKAEAIEKQVNPPLIADITMKNQPSSSIPGDVTYVSDLGANSGMRPMYVVNPDINAMMQDIEAVERRISRGMFNDLFMMLSENPTDRTTAFEISARISEKLNVLGPVIENLITETLKPKLKRIYQIMKRRGFIPPVPESMKEMAMDVEFVSMLALAQQGSKTSGYERLVSIIGNVTPVFPEAKDNLNIDNFINDFNAMLGNSDKILRDSKEVAEIRKQQQQQMKAMQAQSEIAQAAQVAKTGAQAAQVMADTDVGAGQSALASMLGG